MIECKTDSKSRLAISLIVIILFFFLPHIISGAHGELSKSYKVDLADIFDFDDGTYELSWTAPGDDGTVGIADYYIIKYSSQTIDDDNWDQATDAINPPAPLEAGNIQDFTVTGLTPGGFFYYAIKTVDDAGNISQLSNIASGYATGIQIPDPLETMVDSLDGTAQLTARTVISHLTVFYEFALDTSLSFASPVIQVCLLSDSLATTTYVDLLPSVEYHWRCRAMASNHSDSSHWSDSRSFTMSSEDIIAPQVTAVSPNGRERWDALSTHVIHWNQNDNNGISDYRLDYSTDGGDNWLSILDWSPADADSFAWNLPNHPSRRGRIMVSCRDAAGNIGSDISDRNFTIRDIIRPQVHLIYPNGGDSLEVGQNTAIVWEATDNIAIDSFMLEYSSNGSSWHTIVPWTGGNPGLFAWQTPADFTGQCLLRASCIDPDSNFSSDTSDTFFYIYDYQNPEVDITSPTPGDTIDGESIVVSWRADDNGVIAHYAVSYSTDNGASWVEMLSDIGGDSGYFVWPNPGIGIVCGIKVTCFDGAENAGADSVFFLPVSINGSDGTIPTAYALSQNYPNPFNPSTQIRYSLPTESFVRLEIFDLLGHPVAVLIEGWQASGYHEATWNSEGFASGTYIYRLTTGQFHETKKAQLIK